MTLTDLVIQYVITTVLVALAGGFLGLKTKFPAGAIIGSLIAVAAMQIFTGKALLLPNTKLFTQCIAGLFIGKNITRKNVAQLRTVWKSAIITTVGVISFCIAMGYVLSFFSSYDLATALFCCAPGGMLDMTLAADDMGADASVVSVIQLGRYIAVVLFLPEIIRRFARQRAVKKTSEEPLQLLPVASPTKKRPVDAVLTLLIAVACGFAGAKTSLPASGLIFSMFGVMIFNLTAQKAFMPVWVKRMAQILAGGVIGTNITMDSLLRIYRALIPAVCVTLGFMLMNVLIGVLVFKMSDFDLMTALFCCCPGGMSDVVLIADDYGADTPKVTLVQLARCVCAMTFFPAIVYFLAA